MAGALDYLNSTGTFYVIDTTKIPQGEKAWDMERNMYENGFKKREMVKQHIDENKRGFDNDFDAFRVDDDDKYIDVPFDETKGEVNVSYIPRNAIIGSITVPERYRSFEGTTKDRLESIQSRITWSKEYVIKFNPEYKPE